MTERAAQLRKNREYSFIPDILTHFLTPLWAANNRRVLVLQHLKGLKPQGLPWPRHALKHDQQELLGSRFSLQSEFVSRREPSRIVRSRC
jgi:hypothetical protein